MLSQKNTKKFPFLFLEKVIIFFLENKDICKKTEFYFFEYIFINEFEYLSKIDDFIKKTHNSSTLFDKKLIF